MRKLFTRLLLIFAIASMPSVFGVEIEDVALPMRDYDTIEVPVGTFIPVLNAQEISTQYTQEGYKLKFIATNSLYMYDTNIIPANCEFYGYVEKINEPVIGTHASMKIKITKIVLQNGIEMPIRGYIYTKNDNIIGGGMADPTEYIKMLQNPGFTSKPVLQARPGKDLKMGNHTHLLAGDNLIIVLTAPAYITHVLTD